MLPPRLLRGEECNRLGSVFFECCCASLDVTVLSVADVVKGVWYVLVMAKRRNIVPLDDPESQRLNARVERLQAKVAKNVLASEMGAFDTSRLSGRVRQAAVDRAYARSEQRLDAAKMRAWNHMNRQLANRTVDAGSRSVLEGMRSFMRGGGGSRLTGR
jgi:hypothetical protein